jgi:hypothetical protein
LQSPQPLLETALALKVNSVAVPLHCPICASIAAEALLEGDSAARIQRPGLAFREMVPVPEWFVCSTPLRPQS